MKVRVRDAGRYLSVDVAAEDCPARACFWITERAETRGYHGMSSRRCEARCGRRDQTGCPPRQEGEAAKWFKSRGVWKELPKSPKASGQRPAKAIPSTENPSTERPATTRPEHQAHCRAAQGFVCSCVMEPSITRSFLE